MPRLIATPKLLLPVRYATDGAVHQRQLLLRILPVPNLLASPIDSRYMPRLNLGIERLWRAIAVVHPLHLTGLHAPRAPFPRLRQLVPQPWRNVYPQPVDYRGMAIDVLRPLGHKDYCVGKAHHVLSQALA